MDTDKDEQKKTDAALEDDDDRPILEGVRQEPAPIAQARDDEPTPLAGNQRWANVDRKLMGQRCIRKDHFVDGVPVKGEVTEFVKVTGLRHVNLNVIRLRPGTTFGPTIIKLQMAELAMLIDIGPGVLKEMRARELAQAKRRVEYRPTQAEPAHKPGVPRGTTSPR